MRNKFSVRNNLVITRDAFQIGIIDNELKNRIWNQIQNYYFDRVEEDYYGIKFNNDYIFFQRVYDEFFKSHVKTSRNLPTLNVNIKKTFFSFKWYEIYDFIEYISEIYWKTEVNKTFQTKVNQVLEDEMAGYRFVKEYIVQIIDTVEINEIEEAIDCEYSGVKRHLSNSLESLSDKENPDFINSIKESISAVESVLNLISGKNNIPLNKAINNLPFEIDKNFKQAMVKNYSWTSSADGIRHGSTSEEIISSFAEAKYMLVMCSAFVNYVIEKQKNT